jgi:hypothetical protein
MKRGKIIVCHHAYVPMKRDDVQFWMFVFIGFAANTLAFIAFLLYKTRGL